MGWIQFVRRRSRGLAAAAVAGGVAVVCAVALAGPATAGVAEHGKAGVLDVRPIRIAHSGKCLGVAGGSTANGAAVIQYGCNFGLSQSWSLNQNEQIINDKSRKCLDVRRGSGANGARIVQYTCGGATKSSQKFRYEVRNPTPLRTGSTLFNKCLEVPRSSTADGVQLQQFSCNGGRNQLFSFRLRSP